MSAFEAYAEASAPYVTRRQNAGATSSRVAAVREERDALSKSYRAARAGWMEAVLLEPGGDDLRDLLRWMDGLTIGDADRLVARIAAAGWLRRGSPDLRFLALSEIDRRIVRLRERAGLAPFDDPLPGEADNAFIVIRDILTGGNA